MAGEKRSVAKLREHSCADLVPEMSTEEWDAFLADAGVRGIDDPLAITAAGVVLDGRHRLRAARALGLRHLPVRVVAPEDEVEYIVRAATLRRQLDKSQRAAMAVQLADYHADQERGRARQRANLRNSPLEVADLPPRAGRTRDRYADLVAVGTRLIQDANKLKLCDPALFAQVARGELTVNNAMRQLKQAERYATIHPAGPLPNGTFDLIYADPPWDLGNPDSAYSPEQYYPTMTLAEICALPVPAAKDALLYLWAVSSHLPDALAAMQAWGFEYVGCEVWVKDSIGMGNWTRYRHELLLIGRKGNASPAERTRRLDSVIEAPRRAHSQKPDLVYERLEHLYPHLPKLELFARGTPRPGWTAWGNQLDTENEAEAA